jgi:hypothetical protein
MPSARLTPPPGSPLPGISGPVPRLPETRANPVRHPAGISFAAKGDRSTLGIRTPDSQRQSGHHAGTINRAVHTYGHHKELVNLVEPVASLILLGIEDLG